MQVSVRYFAIARERVGLASEEIDLEDGATVAGLWARLEGQHEILVALRPHIRVAINLDFASDDSTLSDGDVVALIPPVAGGSGPRTMCHLTSEPIDPNQVIRRVERPEAGAVVTFRGVVRNHADGKTVVSLEYEVYPEMALTKLEEVRLAIQAEHPESLIAVTHRHGTLQIGDLAVVIAVSSAHRHDAFEACLEMIDRIKETVPIWKKEFGPDGSSWVGMGS